MTQTDSPTPPEQPDNSPDAPSGATPSGAEQTAPAPAPSNPDAIVVGQASKGKAALIQAIKFTLLSITAAGVEVASFALMVWINSLTGWFPFWVSQSVSIALSVIYNFTVNRHFTFKSANNVPIAMLKVALFYVFFIPLTSWGGQILSNMGWADWLLKGISLLLNFVGEFLWWKFVVFRGSENTNSLAVKQAEKSRQKSVSATE
ncbi:GtrA family protein [uncultured Mobiluncus sp.]|uniref:GtrA family protein n=1 Tax=uncultured Mobiluncus sp. TaxID=293425 RepID=UPI0026193059|nr:GtrA family protein [uncultured Mobiluncus sp.]